MPRNTSSISWRKPVGKFSCKILTLGREKGSKISVRCAGGKSPQRYLLGAHYDACDTGEGINPGADDNASGVAALLAVAESLPDSQPAYTIELVAWACEEPPWFGTDDMGSARREAQCSLGP